MLEKELSVPYDLNMKLDVIGAFSMEAGHFSGKVKIQCGEKEANAKSVLGIINLEIAANKPFRLSVEGDDEESVFAKLEKILNSACEKSKR